MQILAIAELGKRYSNAKYPINKISCAKDVFTLFYDKIKDEKQEHFYIILLSTKNNIIGEHLISKGVLDSAILEPREVFRPAIKNAASRIIVLHNHPSGDPKPSKEDIEITEKLIEAGDIINIKILDHIIIGKDNYWSWREDK